MQWPMLTESERIDRLNPPSRKVDMVLDTDTYNEVDDQFALCYALLSPEAMNVQAVYAAPFFNSRSSGPADGMERSYQEILRLLDTMSISADGFVFRGSDCYLPGADSPVESAAARDLVERAMARPDGDPLYVLAIGAITNVASALLMAPEIVRKIVVVWLAGTPLTHATCREFNLSQDYHAARVVFDSGVPLVLIPCAGVASHLLTTMPELEAHLGNKNAMCDALIEILATYHKDHYAWAKVIWDISAVAWLIQPKAVPTVLEHSPLVSDQHFWGRDPRRHLIRVTTYVDRNPIFKDMFLKLSGYVQ